MTINDDAAADRPVWYRQTCRGGYGFQRDVPAVLVREPAEGRSRATIRVLLTDGTSKQIVVAMSNLRPRLMQEPQ